MGIIEKQSKNNLLILVFAVLFGALNNMILFPTALSKEEWGIIRFLPTVAIIVSNIALLGSPQILLRFMPVFLKKDHQNHGLFRYSIKLTLIGLSLVLILLFVGKSSILELYKENASRLSVYFFYLIPLIILNSAIDLLSAYSRAYLKSVFQTFLREILHRVVQAILLLLVIFNVIDFELFIILFVFSLSINIVLIIYYLKREKVWDFKFLKLKREDEVKMFKYGSANVFTSLGATVTSRIDSLMVTAMVSVGVIATGNGGLEAVAIYAFGAYMVSVIEMPARAIASIAASIIAKAWQENDLKELGDIYKKTSINQMIVGCFIFICIWAGVDELFELIGKYEEAKWVVFYLGIGKIIVISAGPHGTIIVNSKYYLFTMFSMILLAILTFGLNLFFIPIFNLEGAAIATVLALIIYNGVSLFYLKMKTGLQPFSFKSVLLLALSLGLFFMVNELDFGLHPIIEIITMGAIVLVIYVPLVYFLKISEDMNETIRKILRRVKLI